MERNKQAFQMRQVSPVSIAHTAAQAVKTKLGRGHCCFETDIPDELPEIQADHDAMVTVLVNLLDNAYKYSYDEKQIKLSVTGDNGSGALQRHATTASASRAGPSRRSSGGSTRWTAACPAGPKAAAWA